jgi:hypothetical protein
VDQGFWEELEAREKDRVRREAQARALAEAEPIAAEIEALQARLAEVHRRNEEAGEEALRRVREQFAAVLG